MNRNLISICLLGRDSTLREARVYDVRNGVEKYAVTLKKYLRENQHVWKSTLQNKLTTMK